MKQMTPQEFSENLTVLTLEKVKDLYQNNIDFRDFIKTEFLKEDSDLEAVFEEEFEDNLSFYSGDICITEGFSMYDVCETGFLIIQGNVQVIGELEIIESTWFVRITGNLTVDSLSTVDILFSITGNLIVNKVWLFGDQGGSLRAKMISVPLLMVSSYITTFEVEKINDDIQIIIGENGYGKQGVILGLEKYYIKNVVKHDMFESSYKQENFYSTYEKIRDNQ